MEKAPLYVVIDGKTIDIFIDRHNNVTFINNNTRGHWAYLPELNVIDNGFGVRTKVYYNLPVIVSARDYLENALKNAGIGCVIEERRIFINDDNIFIEFDDKGNILCLKSVKTY